MFKPGPLTAWEAAELNRLRDLLRQNPPVVRGIAPVTVTRGLNETILGLGSGTGGGGGGGGQLALLIAEDAGPPVRYQYREITTPNLNGDSAANTSYDMVLGSTTGYAYEIDNRKCTVVADPGAVTYTGDPWAVSIVRVYTIGSDNYFEIDQTAQDDKPGWVSPVSTGQQWYGRKASRWYTHPTFKFTDPAYTSAQAVSLDGEFFGFSEDDGLVNVDGAVSPVPSLTQMGVLKYTGTTYDLAEMTDRAGDWRYPKWYLTDISNPAAPGWLKGGAAVVAETGTDGVAASGRHMFGVAGMVAAVKNVTDGSGRYSDGAGVSANGPSRFRSDAGSTSRDTGPALICGVDSGGSGEDANTITFAASRGTFDVTTGSPPSTGGNPNDGLGFSATYQCTTDFIVRAADNVASEGGQSLRFGCVRFDSEGVEVTLLGADKDYQFNVFYPASGFHSAYYIRHTVYFRAGLFIWDKSEVFAGEPDPPTLPPA